MMNNYDPIDTGDPQLDFDTQQQILVNALKQAQVLQQPQFKAYQGNGRVIAPYQPGADLGNVFNRAAGQMDQRGVQQDMTRLGQEEGRRFDQGMADLTRINPAIDYEDPAQLAGDNANRLNAVGQMMRLPNARKFAEQAAGKMSSFGDTIATLKMKQLAADQARLENNTAKMQTATLMGGIQAENNRLSNQTRLDIAGMRSQETPEDKAAAKEEAKLRAAQPKEYNKTEDFIQTSARLQGDVKSVLNDKAALRAVTGIADGRTPTFFPRSMLAERNIDNLKSNMLVEGKRILSESGKPGSISVQEWPIFQNMVAKLELTDNTQVFIDQLTRISDYLNEKMDAAKRGYLNTHGPLPDGVNFSDPAKVSEEWRTKRATSTLKEGGVTSAGSRGRGAQSALPQTTTNAKGQTIMPRSGYTMENTGEALGEAPPTITGQKLGKDGKTYNIYSDGTAEISGGQ